MLGVPAGKLADHAAPKLLWWREHEPDAFRRAALAVDTTGLLVCRLTGEPTIDRITAADYLLPGGEPTSRSRSRGNRTRSRAADAAGGRRAGPRRQASRSPSAPTTPTSTSTRSVGLGEGSLLLGRRWSSRPSHRSRPGTAGDLRVVEAVRRRGAERLDVGGGRVDRLVARPLRRRRRGRARARRRRPRWRSRTWPASERPSGTPRRVGRSWALTAATTPPSWNARSSTPWRCRPATSSSGCARPAHPRPLAIPAAEASTTLHGFRRRAMRSPPIDAVDITGGVGAAVFALRARADPAVPVVAHRARPGPSRPLRPPLPALPAALSTVGETMHALGRLDRGHQ